MLETLRTFARERPRGERASSHDLFRRHAEHYTRFAEAADAGLAGPDEVGVAHAGPPRARQPARRVRPLPHPRRGRRRAPRAAHRRRARVRSGERPGPGHRRVGRAPRSRVSISRPRRCGPRCSRRRRSARRVATTSTRCASYSEAALRDGVPPDCPGAVWAYIAMAANEGMRGDWHGAIRVIADAEAALRSRRRMRREVSRSCTRRRPTSTTCWATSTQRARDAELSLEARAALAEPDRDRQRAVRARGRAQPRRSASGGRGARREHRPSVGSGTSGGLLGFALARRSVHASRRRRPRRRARATRAKR